MPLYPFEQENKKSRVFHASPQVGDMYLHLEVDQVIMFSKEKVKTEPLTPPLSGGHPDQDSQIGMGMLEKSLHNKNLSPLGEDISPLQRIFPLS